MPRCRHTKYQIQKKKKSKSQIPKKLVPIREISALLDQNHNKVMMQASLRSFYKTPEILKATRINIVQIAETKKAA